MPEREEGEGTGTSVLPDRVTMPLLTLITQQSLEEDYLHVAERRVSGEQRDTRRGPHRAAAAAVVIFGVLIATAAVQTSRNDSVDAAGRSALIERANERRETVSKMQDRIVELRAENSEAESSYSQLVNTEQLAVNRMRRLQVSTGFIAVKGEGVRFELDDAAGADEVQRVRADDIRVLVNGLWQAGAEAIAINGERLTLVSRINNSGAAVQVNSQPLSPPYTIEAIGDTRDLQADFLDTTSGVTFTQLASDLGFVFTRQNENQLSLPAAPSGLMRLRAARAETSANPDKKQEAPKP